MNCREIFVMTLFDLILECSRTAAHYTKNYGGYNLTCFDDAGTKWSTQAGAQGWCSRQFSGASLASVINADLQKNIEQFANDAIDAKVLNTNIIVLNGQLQPTDWLWLNGQSLRNTDVQGQSTDSTYLLYAYLMPGNYSLMTSKPTDRRSYLCQFSGETSNCVDNGFQFSGRCYRKYDDPKLSWFDARKSCQGGGGDLASFAYLDRDTFSTLNSSGFNPSASTGYWVGLKRVKWTWLDTGSEANFTYWFDGHPSNYSKKCICLGDKNRYNWKWIECDCAQDQQFICFTVISGNTITSDPRTTSKWIPSTPEGLSSSMWNDIQPPQSTSSMASLATADNTRFGLAIGLGVGLSLATVVVILGIVLALKARQHRTLKRGALRKPEGNIGNPAHAGSTVASEGDVAHPYEGLGNDSMSNDLSYQELDNYETPQPNS